MKANTHTHTALGPARYISKGILLNHRKEKLGETQVVRDLDSLKGFEKGGVFWEQQKPLRN